MIEVQYDRFGPPSLVTKCVNVPEPGEPAAWDVIVEVEACPINPSDLAMIQGRYGKLNKPPATIGMEGCGIVTAIGESVDRVSVGDRVMLLANDNWAQIRKIPAALVVKAPEDLDPLQVALMKVNPATALMMLRTHKISSREWVIQNAPLSSVGRTILQIAKQLNYRTINIVRRPDAVQEVLDLGGDIALEDGDDIVSRVRSAIGRGKVKLALDAVGGKSTFSISNCLDAGGHIINYGMLSGEPCRVGPDQLIFKGVNLSGFWLSSVLNRCTDQERQDLYTEVIEFMQAGNCQATIDSCYRMSDISEALKRAESQERNGKVMILPNGDISGASITA